MSLRALCEIVSPLESSFSRGKTHIVYAEVQRRTALCMCARKFRISIYTPVQLSLFRSPHAPIVRGTKDSVPHWRNLLGTRRRSSRRNFALLSRFPLASSSRTSSPLNIPSLSTFLFYIYRLREFRVPDANLTCTTTNEARRKGFERA